MTEVVAAYGLGSLGALFLAGAAGAWAAYGLLIREAGPGIDALGWDGVGGLLWLCLGAALLGLALLVIFASRGTPWAGLSVGGFSAGVFLLSTFVYLKVGNLVDVGAVPETSASRGELLLPIAGLLGMTLGCVLALIELRRPSEPDS